MSVDGLVPFHAQNDTERSFTFIKMEDVGSRWLVQELDKDFNSDTDDIA